jgi:glycosyltransferase involved in cell wall biosynthesis
MDWPLVLLEALAYGVPCVVGAGTAAAELEASGAVTVVPPGMPEALAEALDRVLGDPEAARRRAEGGRRWVEGTCSPTTVARACEALYDEVC